MTTPRRLRRRYGYAASARYYIRFQPPGLGLDSHTSETSEGMLPIGFVFAYADIGEALWGDWTPFSPGWRRKRLEVLTFTGSNVYDPGDAEGIAVRPSRLIRRETMASWLRRIARTTRDADQRRVARELLGDR